ncbi:NUDIX hydrolase [Roseicyclus marinus]|uniref:NUDIX hydrolase n=1 Tax=Roseicyclus marinus TaxID=2161673 RepID=UPI00240F1715|nr:NUDIX hydrolase [Roseicyclus marinus]MDG3039815.1 NUDIX hydrolase [Roseicyclus marinus]
MTEYDQPPTDKRPHQYKFPMVSVAADVACFTVHPEDGLMVALARRSWDSDAFAGYWALPGGFLQAKLDRTIADCAHRELLEETGVQASHLELVDVFSDIARDPRPERVLSVAFLAIIPDHSLTLAPIPETDVTVARWFAYERAIALDLAFDHRQIIEAARTRLAGKIGFGAREHDEPELLFAFLPDRFPIARAEQVVSDIKGTRPERANFRKWIGRYVRQTEQTEPARTRHAHLYERMPMGLPQASKTPAPMSVVHDLARTHGMAELALFTDGMRGAPSAAVAFLEQVLARYADHPSYSIKVTRVPDLRINERHTGRVLLTLTWQVRNQVFACTALASKSSLERGDFDELKAWNGKPHQSAFRLAAGLDDLPRVVIALGEGLAVLERRMSSRPTRTNRIQK